MEVQNPCNTFLLILHDSLYPAVLPQCPKDWLKFQTNCYYFSADQQPWEKAMSNCQSLNAHLVVIDDKNDIDKQVSHSL